MSDELTKYDLPQDAIASLRSLVAEHGYDALSITKTAVKDGAKG